MSIQQIDKVLKLRGAVTDGEFRVLAYLADRAAPDGGKIFVSVAILTDEVDMTKRYVNLVLKRLREWGWLIVVRQGGIGHKGRLGALRTVYHLNLPDGDQLELWGRNLPAVAVRKAKEKQSDLAVENQGDLAVENLTPTRVILRSHQGDPTIPPSLFRSTLTIDAAIGSGPKAKNDPSSTTSVQYYKELPEELPTLRVGTLEGSILDIKTDEATGGETDNRLPAALRDREVHPVPPADNRGGRPEGNDQRPGDGARVPPAGFGDGSPGDRCRDVRAPVDASAPVDVAALLAKLKDTINATPAPAVRPRYAARRARQEGRQ